MLKKGHLGLNGNAGVSFDMFGAGISLDVAKVLFWSMEMGLDLV